jgi:hypothetical protein
VDERPARAARSRRLLVWGPSGSAAVRARRLGCTPDDGRVRTVASEQAPAPSTADANRERSGRDDGRAAWLGAPALGRGLAGRFGCGLLLLVGVHDQHRDRAVIQRVVADAAEQ